MIFLFAYELDLPFRYFVQSIASSLERSNLSVKAFSSWKIQNFEPGTVVTEVSSIHGIKSRSHSKTKEESFHQEHL